MNKIEINGSATNGKINGNGNAEVTTTNGKSNGNCPNGCSSKTNGSDVNEAKELDMYVEFYILVILVFLLINSSITSLRGVQISMAETFLKLFFVK